MAQLKLDGFEELNNVLVSLENYDVVAPEMLNTSIDVVEKNLKKRLENHKKSADMIESIKSSKAKKSQYGWYAQVRPTGKDSNGVRNMEKLAYIHYGTSHQAPDPVLTKAINDSAVEVEERMQAKFNEIVGEMIES